MREKLEEIKKNALDVLQKATDIDALEEARIKFLGKKGELTAVLKGMGQLSKEERPQIGALANEIRGVIENHIDTKKAEISAMLEEIKLKMNSIPCTLFQPERSNIKIIVQDFFYHGIRPFGSDLPFG